MPAQTVIKFRRDTSANWASANPVLASGEAGYDTTEKKLKIGDGTTAWSGLDFASGSASVVVAETAPTGAEEGNVWYNSTEGTSYIYYDATWVPLSPAIVGPEGPQGPIGETGPTGPQGEPGVGVPTIDSATAGEMLVSNGSTAEWSNTVTANSASVPAIIAKGADSQSQSIQQWQNSAGTTLARVSETGGLGAASVVTRSVTIDSTFGNAGPVRLDLKLNSSNTSGNSPMRVYAEDGSTILAEIGPTGLLTATPATPDALSNSAKRIGYVGMPRGAAGATTGNWTFTLEDAGEHIYSTANRSIFIPGNSAGAVVRAFEIGTTIVLVAGAGATVTISIVSGTTDTCVLAGGSKTITGGSGSMSLAPWGMATFLKVDTNTWIASGNGLT